MNTSGMKLLVNAGTINFESTSHGIGLKKVLLEGTSAPDSVTQIALGALQAGEEISSHVHPTMEEIFYFLKGSGEYVIDGRKFPVTQASLVRVPAGVPHALRNTGDEQMEFFYFGLATDQ